MTAVSATMHREPLWQLFEDTAVADIAPQILRSQYQRANTGGFGGPLQNFNSGHNPAVQPLIASNAHSGASSTLPMPLSSLLQAFPGFGPQLVPRSPVPCASNGSMDDLHALSAFNGTIHASGTNNHHSHSDSFFSPLRPLPPYSSPAMLTKNYNFIAPPTPFQPSLTSVASSPASPSTLIMGSEPSSRTGGLYSRHLNLPNNANFSPAPNDWKLTPHKAAFVGSHSQQTFTPSKSPFAPLYQGVPHSNLNKMLNPQSSPLGHSGGGITNPYLPSTFSPFVIKKSPGDFIDDDVTLQSYASMPSLSTITDASNESPLHHQSFAPSHAVNHTSSVNRHPLSLFNSQQSNLNTIKRHFDLTSSNGSVASASDYSANANNDDSNDSNHGQARKKQKLSRSASVASHGSDTGRGSPEPGSHPAKQQGLAKGLRHFSMRVCKKVEAIGETTYNAVADQLVAELQASALALEEEEDVANGDDDDYKSSKRSTTKKKAYDEKNVRRRVYDALNVLMAMGIIEKDKKRIAWIGLPGGVAKQVNELQTLRAATEARIADKRQHLQDLLVYVVALKNLKQRNEVRLQALLASQRSSTTNVADLLPNASNSIPLRFLLIKTDPRHIVHLSVSADQSELNCEVSGEFMLHTGEEVLSLMGLGQIDSYDLPQLIPREIATFYPQHLIRTTKNQSPTVNGANFAGKLAPGSVLMLGGDAGQR